MKPETLKAIERDMTYFYHDIAMVAQKNVVRSRIAGDLKAHKLLGISPAFNLVQKEALEFAKDYGKMLTDDGATIIQGKKIPWLNNHVFGKDAGTRAKVADVINRGLKEGKPVADIAGKKAIKGTIAYDLKQIMKEEDRSMVKIARTEVARVQSAGAMERYKANNVKKLKWLCAADPCPICVPYCNLIFDIAEVPEVPVHPNCRCDRAPIISSIDNTNPTTERVNELSMDNSEEVRRYAEELDKSKASVLKYGSPREDLSESAQRALRNYQGTYDDEAYKLINGQLRGGTLTSAQRVEAIRDIKELDKLLASAKLPVDMPVYRGLGKQTAEKLLKKNVYTDSAFVSTSLDPTQAVGFAARTGDGYYNVMRIVAKKNTNALYLSPEREILLPRGCKLKCTGITEIEKLEAWSEVLDDLTENEKVRIFIMEII